MGFRYRKSINLGAGFRVNLSKSGVGYSWGVPGYRITKTSHGKIRKTYSIPGTGISYVDNSSTSQKRSSGQIKQEPYVHENAYTSTDTVNINDLKQAEYKDFIRLIERYIKINYISNYLCLGLIGIPSMNPILTFIGILGLAGKIFAYTNLKVSVEYELDDYSRSKYNSIVDSWLSLQTCNRIWQIISESKVSNTKINAGASRNVKRLPFTILKKSPSFLKTNIPIVQLKMPKETIILLPDRMLVIKKTKIGAINYDSVNITQNSVSFIETAPVPKDAEIKYYTWQYVNKNGQPDKRFKNNRQLPVCNYGVLNIKSYENLSIELQCSNYDKTVRFTELYN